MSVDFILIDDNETFRSVLARSLARLNHEVSHYSHPKEALVRISEINSPVVLLDLKLQEDSGLRWIKDLKQANSQAQIILLTGYASISTAVEAIKLGADDYLAKPVTARDILAHLNKAEQGTETPITDKPMSVDRLEWEHIQKVLQDQEGNISAAARALGMHRRTLQRKLAKRPVKS